MQTNFYIESGLLMKTSSCPFHYIGAKKPKVLLDNGSYVGLKQFFCCEK